MAEAVPLGPAPVVWLVRALHRLCLLGSGGERGLPGVPPARAHRCRGLRSADGSQGAPSASSNGGNQQRRVRAGGTGRPTRCDDNARNRRPTGVPRSRLDPTHPGSQPPDSARGTRIRRPSSWSAGSRQTCCQVLRAVEPPGGAAASTRAGSAKPGPTKEARRRRAARRSSGNRATHIREAGPDDEGPQETSAGAERCSRRRQYPTEQHRGTFPLPAAVPAADRSRSALRSGLGQGGSRSWRSAQRSDSACPQVWTALWTATRFWRR
jgi:hypothetical protein